MSDAEELFDEAIERAIDAVLAEFKWATMRDPEPEVRFLIGTALAKIIREQVE